MNKFLFPFLAVVIGFVLAQLTSKQKSINTKLLLSFSGAFLLALTLFELLPEVYHHLDSKLAGVYIVSGILLQLILELFSKGAEHGHVHIHKEDTTFPWSLFISLCLHSFLEGFAIHDHNDMVYGILIHKIPVAAIITMFLLQSEYKKIQIAGFLLVFALMTPLGTLISTTSEAVAHYSQVFNAIVIGVFFHISTTILFESSDGHKFNLSKFISIILGVIVAYLI
ncbi:MULTISPECIES: ZIP family metal transporter [Aestuariibaculum]|uniref:ZIP family metal transporter n=1 Tax=Aestuariibaculum lutulentum TaxID=2920935 RepID=A0ABS9RIH8_9FLAO|nr:MULTISPECIES: ZIP family metal transporter [Aestuariibaculum]MCH4552759.1 ZIP family metal transporter [Aestuariibaculum lutulentum]MCR8669350.1 ZIP family metal transporter [Aestuariibaculum sp. M13]